VAPLNPEHLFEQALRLTEAPAGRPRQADLKRAISAAYYGLFHIAITAGTEVLIGANHQDPLYGLIYRSVDHRRLRELCEEVIKPKPSTKYAPYLPSSGIGPDLIAFATAVKQLQEERHTADYDPSASISRSNALASIATAQSAVRRFKAADANAQAAFLCLLFFQPRSGRA
jgi:uncharacterized protein (UPF0332 family)